MSVNSDYICTPISSLSFQGRLSHKIDPTASNDTFPAPPTCKSIETGKTWGTPAVKPGKQGTPAVSGELNPPTKWHLWVHLSRCGITPETEFSLSVIFGGITAVRCTKTHETRYPANMLEPKSPWDGGSTGATLAKAGRWGTGCSGEGGGARGPKRWKAAVGSPPEVWLSRASDAVFFFVQGPPPRV